MGNEPGIGQHGGFSAITGRIRPKTDGYGQQQTGGSHCVCRK